MVEGFSFYAVAEISTTIGLAQQLLGKTKAIIGKELVYVKVSTIEAFKFLWLIDGKQ